MTTLEAFFLYHSLHRHFTSDYCFFRYKGKIKYTDEQLDKRPDRHQYVKLSRHRFPLWLVLGACLAKEKVWIGDLFSEEFEDLAAERMGNVQSLSYHLQGELKKIKIPEDLEIEDNRHPKLARLFLGNRISPETLSVVLTATESGSTWSTQMNGDPILGSVIKKGVKYFPFLGLKQQKAKELVFSSLQTA
jgi:hypothetical protein